MYVMLYLTTRLAARAPAVGSTSKTAINVWGNEKKKSFH